MITKLIVTIIATIETIMIESRSLFYHFSKKKYLGYAYKNYLQEIPVVLYLSIAIKMRMKKIDLGIFWSSFRLTEIF